MSAPMKLNVFKRILARNHHIKFNYNIKSLSINNIMCPRNQCEQMLSLRTKRRKRAFEHCREQQRAQRPCNSYEDLNGVSKYYIQNGLRKVYPYYYTFTTYVKDRWIGKTILDVCQTECRHTGVNPAFEIERGNVTVNGEKVPLYFVLGCNMKIEHNHHRHEIPVLNEPIKVVEETDELLVINKPPSIPVHPCGSYRYNSVTKLLEYEFGYDNLKPLFRLDRLTSGLLIFMKTTKVERKLRRQLEGHRVHKEYVCRVEGKFPDGEVVCNEPLICMSYGLPLHRVDPNGKPSSTTFTRLSYNGKTSVVKCHPVCQDPLYNRTAFGPNKGKGGIIENTPEEIEDEIIKTTRIGRWKIGDNPKYYQNFGNKRDHIGSIEVTNYFSEGNIVKLENNSWDAIKESTDATEDVTKVHLERDFLQQDSQRIEKSSQLVRKMQDFEIISKISDQLCKSAKTEKNFDQGLHITQSCPNSPFIQENCVIQSDKDIMENSFRQSNDVRSEQSFKCNKYSETSTNIYRYNNKVKSERHDFVQNMTDPEVIDSKTSVDEFCEDCKYIYEDPKLAVLCLYLHAVRYKGPDWEYSTPLPYWAAEDFDKQDNTGTE